MKKLSFSLLAMLGFFAIAFISCKEDEDPIDILPPSVNKPGDTSVDPGATVNLSFSVTAPGGFQSSSVASSDEAAATATISTDLSSNDEDGTLVVTVTGVAEGQTTITLTVTDQEAQSTNSDVVVTVNPAGEPGAPPTISAAVLDTISGGSLTVLSDALEATNLFGDLSSADNITLFAPNNDAFTALLTELGTADLTALVGALGADGVTTVLQGHVVADSLTATEVVALTDSVATLNSEAKIGVVVDGNDVFVNGAQVLTTDIKVANGVIHIIDSVINLPDVPAGPKTRVDITDADLAAGQTYNWTADNDYYLTGLVYVEDGATLNIAEGTTIRFTEETGADNTSALIVTQGSTINAIGTAADPIIFTAEADTVGGNLLPSDWGAWGGVIILGNAPAEKGGVTSNISIEGVDSNENRAVYGGSDAADNSGTLQYVSIRYTGVGIAPNSEIQGLTLGGVGSGTTIDHIDIYSSNDDGIEIFGGTVDINYASVAFATDDAFDFDEGYQGNIQFAFVLQLDGDETVYDQAGEWDGAIPDDAALFSAPNIYNATFLGPGQSSTGAQRALIMRDAFAGKLGNSIIEDFPGIGLQVEDIEGTIDSYARIGTAENGFQIEILNNTWAQFGGATDLASLVQATSVSDDLETQEDETFNGESADIVSELTDNANEYSAAAVVTSISRNPDGGLDPRPAATTSATTTVPQGMMQVDYRGAFAPGEATWLAGWSTLSKVGILFE